MSLLDAALAPLRARMTKLERSHPAPREGKVTQASPMQVRLDGDSVDTPVRSLVNLEVGARVLCQKINFRYYVMGQIGGVTGVPYAMAAGGLDGVQIDGDWSIINFPPGRFTRTPHLFGTVINLSAASYGTSTRFRANSELEGQVHVHSPMGRTGIVVVDWVAVQMTPTSAGG